MPDLIRPDWPAPANIQAFTTTRNGGVSKGPWRTWNLGERCGDSPQHVQRNREILRELLPGEPQWLRQVHGNRVVAWGEESEPEADAVVSRQPGQVCAVLTADCLPVLLCNSEGTEVAACHAGWRGLAAGVIEAAVAAMQSQPAEIMAWLGPAIGPKAYEVGNEVYVAFTDLNAQNASAFAQNNDRWLADLYQLARLALARAGIVTVFGGRHCTNSESDKFFSYRRDGQTGRMASVVWMTNSP